MELVVVSEEVEKPPRGALPIQAEKGREGCWTWIGRHKYWVLIREGYRVLVVKGGDDWGVWVRLPGAWRFSGGRKRYETDEAGKVEAETWLKKQLATT